MSAYCDEMPSFYTEGFPVARKVHECVECDAPILKGEKHLHVRAIQDGEWWTARQHMACRELCMAIREIEDCIPFGMVKEDPFDLEILHEEPAIRKLYARVLNRERTSRHSSLTPRVQDQSKEQE